MSTATDTRIEDLEVSVRTMGLLSELGVETVAELLALPSISTTPQVVAELTAVLADLDLAYTGEWNLPEPPPVLEATGTITERWDTIETWLEDNAPAALAYFHPAATADDIARAEAELGHALPADYKELLQRHNGQRDLGPMVGFCSLLQTKELKQRRDWLAGLMNDGGGVDESAIDKGIQAVTWHPAWFPIGNFQRDYMILDMAPAPGGTAGQIFLCYVDDSRRKLIATSCADLLSRYFRELQDGTIDLAELDEDS